MKLINLAKFMLGLCFAGGFIWLVVRNLNLAELMALLYRVRIDGVLLAVLIFMAGYACRIARWKAMLQRDNTQIQWIDCAGPFLASFAANNVLPFRAGDVMRTFAYSSQLGVNSGAVLASMFVERLLDLLMVLVALGCGLIYFELDANHFVGIGGVGLLCIALLIVVLLLFPRLLKKLSQPFVQGLVKVLPRFGEPLSNAIQNAFATLEHLSGLAMMFRLLLWSAVAWALEGCVFWTVALTIPDLVAPLASWLALPVGTLATLIPSTPGYVGTFDYFIVQAMQALQNPFTAATAYALLIHLVLWLPPTVVGGSYLMLHSFRKLSPKKILS